MSKRLGGIIGLFVQGWLSPRTRATSYPKQVFESGRESLVDAPPLEYSIILIWISALKKILDFVSMSAMCHVKNDFPSSQRVLCKLRCGRMLYSAVVHCTETKFLYSILVAR